MLIVHAQLVQINVIQQKVFYVIIVYVNVIFQQHFGILIINNAVNKSFQNNKSVFFVEYLVPRLNYTQWCTYDSDCLPTLICPTVPDVCTCPQYLPDLACNCANTNYYDPTSSQCGIDLFS